MNTQSFRSKLNEGQGWRAKKSSKSRNCVVEQGDMGAWGDPEQPFEPGQVTPDRNGARVYLLAPDGAGVDNLLYGLK